MRICSVKHLLLLTFCVATGCADGPFSNVASLNPYYRSQWEKDEARGPTFHTQLAELRSLRQSGRSLSPGEQQQVIQLLSGIVTDSDNPVLRAEATLTLAQFPSPLATQALRTAISDPESDVRIAACRAWGTMGGAEALPLLSQLVESDADLDVRMAATDELAKFKDQQAIQALAVALNDKDPALQYRAVSSLKSITGRDYGDSVPAWRDFVEGRTPNPPTPPSIAERLRRMSWF